jgi:hypothetical protein
LFQKNLQISLFWTQHRLTDDYLFDEDMQIRFVNKSRLNAKEILRIKEPKKYVRPLEEIINFINDKQYHYYETVRIYYELENKLKKARRCYKHSLHFLELDPHKVWEQDKNSKRTFRKAECKKKEHITSLISKKSIGRKNTAQNKLK